VNPCSILKVGMALTKYVLVCIRAGQHAALEKSIGSSRWPEYFEWFGKFANNCVLVNSNSASPTYVYRSAALGRVLPNCMALLWVEVGHPWFTSWSTQFAVLYRYKFYFLW